MITSNEKAILQMIADISTVDEIWNIKSVQKLFSDRESLEHIFTGFVSGERFQGYHTEIMYPNKYQQDFCSKNSNLKKDKVYRLYLEGEAKISDCFPLTMSVVDIIIAIDEGYENSKQREQEKQRIVCGYSKTYGLNLRIVKDKNDKIVDAYPPLSENK